MKLQTLRKKCPNTQSFLVRIRENKDQKKLCIQTLSHIEKPLERVITLITFLKNIDEVEVAVLQSHKYSQKETLKGVLKSKKSKNDKISKILQRYL